MKCLLLVLFNLVGFGAFCQTKNVVTRVIDGDTYEVLLDGKIQRVRLQDVDAPELTQSYGRAVKDSLSALIERKTVCLTITGNDLYQRKVATITIDGKALDSLLVAKGFAWFYAGYSHKLELSIYEAEAKAKGIGLWSCREPVPLWIWRKLNARNKRLYGVCR